MSDTDQPSDERDVSPIESDVDADTEPIAEHSLNERTDGHDSNSIVESEQDATGATETDDVPSKGADEVYCASCGEPVKKEAEICPHCGVRQDQDEAMDNASIPDHRVYELQRLASKDMTTLMLVGFFISPVGYVMIGKNGLAILNFLTFNYLLLGPILVPLHIRKIVKDARSELDQNGIEW